MHIQRSTHHLTAAETNTLPLIHPIPNSEDSRTSTAGRRNRLLAAARQTGQIRCFPCPPGFGTCITHPAVWWGVGARGWSRGCMVPKEKNRLFVDEHVLGERQPELLTVEGLVLRKLPRRYLEVDECAH